MNCKILGVLNNEVLYQDNHTKPNGNVLVVGGPGSYKTQSYVLTNVFAESENSIVVTDTKGGKVYEDTVAVKMLQGYKPYFVNFDNMVHSNRYNPLDYIVRDIDATKIANMIVESNNKDSRKDVWYFSQRALLKALILYAVYEFMPEDRNMRGIANFLGGYDVSKNKKGLSELDMQFEKLDINHPARKAYQLGFKKADGEMHVGIMMSLLTTIADFIDAEIAEFTSFSDFDFKILGKEKIILYINVSALDRTFAGLVNLFLTQLIEQLYLLASENHAHLPRNVSFILDEFKSLGKFPNYEEILATCREYGIDVSTIVQSISQLQDLYGKDTTESILGNCAVKICLSASNETTAKYFSNLLGNTTVRVNTGSKSVNKSSVESQSKSDSYNFTTRELMKPDEIQKMPPDEAIIHFTNKNPIKVKKAFQFKLFPGADNIQKGNQATYEGKPDESQIKKFEELTQAFKIGKRKEKFMPPEDDYNAEEFNMNILDRGESFFDQH